MGTLNSIVKSFFTFFFHTCQSINGNLDVIYVTISTTYNYCTLQWMKLQRVYFTCVISCSLLFCGKEKHPQFVVVFENFTLIFNDKKKLMIIFLNKI